MKKIFKMFMSSLTIFCGNTFFTQAQNIGIGVMNPQQKLHVGGNIRVDGLSNSGNGVITTDANGDLLRLNFTGNVNDVLRGNGSFGAMQSGSLPAGAIVGSSNSNDQNLSGGGFSFYGELSYPITTYVSYPAMISEQFSLASTYETGDPNKIQAPAARSGHCALWTGTEMLTWGGYNMNAALGINFLSDGSKYNPATDSWTPMSNVNGPTKRTYFSSVWTGTEAIIWGGLDSVNLYTGVYTFNNNGKKYNPVTNTWSPVSLAIAPAARAWAAAAWTGTYMVIWGGSDLSAIQNNGGRYNPVTNTWSTLSTLNAPLADGGEDRVFWTGSQLIVLGYRDTVARYNPNTNVWSISARCPAGPHYDKTAAVWTGTELWVYANQKIYKYNPNSNIWTTTNISGTAFPTGNIRGAVWTDSELLLFVNDYSDDGRLLGNIYYRYAAGQNTFNYVSLQGETVTHEMTFTRAGSMIIRWGGYTHLEDYDGGTFRFSRKGIRLYLLSGINIPASYAPVNYNNRLYLYRKD